MNDQYSYGDFTQQDLSTADGFTGEIVGSCFQQDEPDTAVFHVDATVTFIRCNLINCRIPAGCTVGEGSCNDSVVEQNDGEDWIVDGQGKPLRPLDGTRFQRFSLSEDPRNIPAEKVDVPVVMQAEDKADAAIEVATLRTRIVQLEADHDLAGAG